MTMSAPWTRVDFGGANQPKGPGERSRTMIIIGADYHPGFQQIAYVDSETGELQERRLEHREEAEKFYRELAESRSAAAAVASTPDGTGAHPDHEPAASGSPERRSALEEEVVAGSRTGTTGRDPVSSVGDPATAGSVGVAGPTEPDDRGVNESG